MKILCSILLSLIVFSNSFAEKIRLSDLTVRQKDCSHTDYTYDKKIDIGNGLSYKISIEVTDRGNGWFKIANLNLHIGRTGYDSLIYKTGLLDVDFVDISGDGFKDIIISGLMLFPHEQMDVILHREAVLFIYLFDPKEKDFKLTYINSSCRLEDNRDDKREFYGDEAVVRKYVETGHKMAEELNGKNPDGTSGKCVRLDGKSLKNPSASNVEFGKIDIGHGIKQDFSMERASASNVWLYIANLKLNVYGRYFNVRNSSGNILDIDFIDLNNDGYRDIIISGMLSYTQSAHEDIILPSEHAVFIYMFDPGKKEFRCAYRNASFRLEEAASEHVRSAVSGAKTAIKNMEKSLEEKREKLALPE